MTPRLWGLFFALIGIGSTLVQFVLAGRDWYHSWQYAATEAIALVVMVAYAWGARMGADGPRGRRVALALVGAIAVSGAGLASGLIGPDTVTIVGAPGGVTPVPDVGAAAFFGPADAEAIHAGTASLTLRRRGAPELSVGHTPTPLDLSVVYRAERPAVYVVAHDERGARLTVTQPTNSTFLSPVLLFRGTQAIGEKTYPFDTFAVPALHRVVRALYFTPADLAAFRHGLPGSDGGVVVSVADDNGAPLGITIAPAGREISIAGLRLTMSLGSYPVLMVASAPQPFVVLGGLALFAIACLWSLLPLPVKETASA